MTRDRRTAASWRLLWFCLVVAWGRLLLGQEAERNRPAPLSPELRQRCLQVLHAALQSDDFWPAMHAAEALTLAGEQDTVRAALAPRLETEQDDQRRCGLARELFRTGDSSALATLWEILDDRESNGRTHAAESVYKIGQVGDRRLLQTAFVQTADPRLQLMAAAALARAGDQTALARLREQVGAEDREIRKIAAWVLGLLGDVQDVAPLKKALARETDPLAQAYFVNALACLGDAESRVALGRNLSAEDPSIRTYSAEFAGYSRCVELRSKLEGMLDDPHVDARVRAAQSLIALSLPPQELPRAGGDR